MRKKFDEFYSDWLKTVIIYLKRLKCLKFKLDADKNMTGTILKNSKSKQTSSKKPILQKKNTTDLQIKKNNKL